ncbi:MAG: hypothetical protein C5B49_04475 [Bdellovibrio sp.]|nr:MAG: hypothetical protein C5B49_04475 [Bdellovibrio sp.]
MFTRGSGALQTVTAYEIDLCGQVQGVGLRPFLFRLASQNRLQGIIFNHPAGAGADLEGDPEDLRIFLAQLRNNLNRPPLKIENLFCRETKPRGFSGLQLVEEKNAPARSDCGGADGAALGGEARQGADLGAAVARQAVGRQVVAVRLSAPPDLATCEQCWQEYLDPASRYYLYPFISCTACGPRWTVTRGLPFDRERTSLADFPLCPECLEIYRNPLDRRFHAQTLSCPKCGPRLSLRAHLAHPRTVGAAEVETPSPLWEVAKRLSSGEVGVLKGLGGFQLVADALNEQAIQRVRHLKARPDQALAVMFRDHRSFLRFGGTAEQWALLKTPVGPILSLPGLHLPTQKMLAPDLSELGVMAPTTPLHLAVMTGIEAMVVTSANRHGMPIPRSVQELEFANQTSSGSAAHATKDVDFILDHNREICFAIDDSVLRGDQILRAARGLRPQVEACEDHGNILALGADLKNSCALTAGGLMIDLPYNGRLENLQGLEEIRDRLKRQLDLFSFCPREVAVDQHPQSVTPLLNLFPNAEVTRVPHHWAHALAVAEDGDLILAFDGTGWNGEAAMNERRQRSRDVWGEPEINGGEGYQFVDGRLHHVLQMAPLPLVGGDSAVREPWKVLVTALTSVGFPEERLFDLLPRVARAEIQVIAQLARSTPLLCSSVGRWFDAASALIVFGSRTQTYEAQAPTILERDADASATRLADCPAPALPAQSFLKEENGKLIFEAARLLPLMAETGWPHRAWLAHAWMAELVASAVAKFSPRRVVGVGGVFQNEIFSKLLAARVKLFRPTHTPVNDQSIARGQLRYLQLRRRREIFGTGAEHA